MDIILGLNQLKRSLENPVVALGNFDGVHLGHQEIFKRVKKEALNISGEAVVITFEPHPLKILSPERCPPLLTPFRQKMKFIERAGMDTVVCIEFTRAFSNTSPFEFVKTILVEKIGARKIIVGYNYHFGKGKEGDTGALKKIGSFFHIDVDVMEPLLINRTVVSSSRIREAIKAGDVEGAGRLLGRDHFIIGKVVEGAKRGRTLGFPTANLSVSGELYPKAGVYAVEVSWKNQTLKGVANVGVNPTFQSLPPETDEKVSFEIYILDFDEVIYGEEIQVNFKKRIRDEVRFGSTADLVRQIERDVQWAQENVFARTDPH